MVGPGGIASGVVRGGLAAGWLATGAFTARNDVIRAVEPARLPAPALWVRGPGVSAPPPTGRSSWLAATGGGADTPGPRTHDAGADRRAGSTARTTPVAMPLGPTIRDHWDADGGSPHSAHRALVGQNGALTSSPP